MMQQQHSTKQRIATTFKNIEGLNQLDKWDITDSDETTGLYNIHAKKDCMGELPHIRGIVLDPTVGKIVAWSYEKETKVTAKSLSELDGNLIANLPSGKILTLGKKNDLIITPGLEPVTIRVFKYKGKIYISTNRRLDCSSSFFGNSDDFLTMYNKCGGPDVKTLFDEKKETSPYVYVFLIHHKDLQCAGRLDAKDGQVLFIDVFPMLDLEDSSQKRVESPCTFVTPISLDQANKMLTMDDNKDYRLSQANFVAVRSGRKLWIVQSEAHEWRMKVHGENPNHRNRYYTLLNYTLDYDVKTFKDSFPYTDDVDDKTPVEKLEEIIYWALMTATSPSHHPDMVDLYRNYIEEKNKVKEFLVKLAMDPKSKMDDMYVRVSQIVAQARKRAYPRLNHPSYQNEIIKNMEYMIARERRESLYRIVCVTEGKRLMRQQ